MGGEGNGRKKNLDKCTSRAHTSKNEGGFWEGRVGMGESDRTGERAYQRYTAN